MDFKILLIQASSILLEVFYFEGHQNPARYIVCVFVGKYRVEVLEGEDYSLLDGESGLWHVENGFFTRTGDIIHLSIVTHFTQIDNPVSLFQ